MPAARIVLGSRCRRPAAWGRLAAVLAVFGACASPDGLAVAPAVEAGATVAEAGAVDPAAWGSDHVGRPLPDYVTGDECLFCHRDDVGPTWRGNPHQQTVRAAVGSPLLERLGETPGLTQLAREATALLGSGRQRVRFLRAGERYGTFDIASVSWAAGTADRPPGWADVENPVWNEAKFGARCAGCHATAVDSQSRAFASPSLDCYTCHGAVDINHTSDTSRMIFAKGRRDPPREVISICGQCHLRGGRSRSTGLPYPNHFVAGDNLFRDFEVDLSRAATDQASAADRHILENVRDVVLEGRLGTTCLTCHQVHQRSTARHAKLRIGSGCYTCHVEGEAIEVVRPYVATSELCEY